MLHLSAKNPSSNNFKISWESTENGSYSMTYVWGNEYRCICICTTCVESRAWILTRTLQLGTLCRSLQWRRKAGGHNWRSRISLGPFQCGFRWGLVTLVDNTRKQTGSVTLLIPWILLAISSTMLSIWTVWCGVGMGGVYKAWSRRGGTTIRARSSPNKLNYWNALLAGLPIKSVWKLQLVQNVAEK